MNRTLSIPVAVRGTVVLGAFLVTSTGPAIADVALVDGFTPVKAELDAGAGSVPLSARGWAACGNAPTTAAPAFSFTLPRAMKDLRLVVNHPAVLVGPDQRHVCLKGAPMVLAEWPAGTWQVYLFGNARRLAGTLTLDQPGRIAAAKDKAAAADEAAARADTALHDAFTLGRFDEAPRMALGALSAPALIETVSSNGGKGPSRLHGCAGIPRTPSFFVTGSAKEVELSGWRGGAATVAIAGPLEDVNEEFDQGVAFRCGLDLPAKIDLSKGTYAVFIATRSPSQAMTLIARQPDLDADPFWAPKPIPGTLSIADRALVAHYPLVAFERQISHTPGTWEPDNVERFFREAPTHLFVSVAAETQGITASEPLVLREIVGRDATVNRLDGTRVDLPFAALVDLPTAAVIPPKLGEPRAVKDPRQAEIDGWKRYPTEIATYRAREQAFKKCLFDYMEKHDPTWNKSYDLVYLDTGETMTDRKFRAADKKCGRAKVDAANKKFVSAFNAAQRKWYADYRRALAARFGTTP